MEKFQKKLSKESFETAGKIILFIYTLTCSETTNTKLASLKDRFFLLLKFLFECSTVVNMILLGLSPSQLEIYSSVRKPLYPTWQIIMVRLGTFASSLIRGNQGIVYFVYKLKQFLAFINGKNCTWFRVKKWFTSTA